ncbi:MAG: hypothetical protein KZQ58_01185 [gamma proteobacterium symbiont of Bathyaustriella thionipta]|nr:hypothetical protein [gamma proteobacterium symbiont of Bathyaustriella thionipta]
MEQNRFFLWISRASSVLFLLLLLLAIGFLFLGVFQSNKWNGRNTVEIVDDKINEGIEDLRLSNITKVCGKDIQYVKLNSSRHSKGFSSGGYGSNIRNVVFFVGQDMQSHWIFDTNKYLIAKVIQLKTKTDDCKDSETVAIYYEVRKEDTDGNGKLDDGDSVTISLTSPDGLNYTEIESNITSVLDHSIDEEASILTLLLQSKKNLITPKAQLLSHHL